jgi:2-C-methyl-D-erythritol 4-phosphate cytidylyltransferase
MSLPRFTLVLPAAGSSTRFGSDKLLATLGGEPVVARTLAAFLDHPALAGVVFAAAKPDEIRRACAAPLARAAAMGLPVRFVPGGPTRAESVGGAVAAAAADVEWVAVHDAARPLVSRRLVDAVLAAAAEHGAAAPALPMVLTVKQAAGPLPSAVVRTLPRATLFALQTPQVARRADLLDALARCPLPPAEVTDDLQLIELAGGRTWLVPGEEQNLKLTTAGDLAVAEAFLQQSR